MAKKAGKRTPQVSRYSSLQHQLSLAEFTSSEEEPNIFLRGLGQKRYANHRHLVDTATIAETLLAHDTYNSVDLFSGLGGLSLGLEQSGIKSLLGVEIDPDSAETYRRNFPDARVFEGDIADLDETMLTDLLESNYEKIHVVAAGFPCQGFSVAGDRDPKDIRNELFSQLIRITELLRPWMIVGENVPGIVTLDEGSFMKRIFDEFEHLGYEISAKILESAQFGVAQYRPRVLFIANRFGKENPYPEPILRDPGEYKTIDEEIDHLMEHPRDPSIGHEWTDHREETIERISKVEPGHSLYDTYRDAFKRQYIGYPSMTIKENHGGTHIHHILDRCISSREMARLQSFPDDFVLTGRMKRQMFGIGNAVPPLLARHVGLALKPTLAEIRGEISEKG